MLRAAFPVEVQAETAAFKIQLATSAAAAAPQYHLEPRPRRGERVARWVIWRTDGGVALLNDCKYSHKVKGHVIDLNLLRCVPYPGPRLVRDRTRSRRRAPPPLARPGRPRLPPPPSTRTSVTSSTATSIRPGTARRAFPRGQPAQPRAGASKRYLLRVESAGCDRGDGETDRRRSGVDRSAYEATGSAVKCRVSFTVPPREVGEVNLLEEPLATLTLQDSAVELAFQPFEIKPHVGSKTNAARWMTPVTHRAASRIRGNDSFRRRDRQAVDPNPGQASDQQNDDEEIPACALKWMIPRCGMGKL